MKKSFVELVSEYREWRLREKGDGKISKQELLGLRERFKKENTAKINNVLKERVEQYRAWKKKEHGTSKITEKEFNRIKEEFLKERENKTALNEKKQIRNEKGNWETYLTNYKKFKETQEPGAKITYRELKMLKENWREAKEKGIVLRESDVGFDPTMGTTPNPAGTDQTAAGMSPATPTQVAPEVATQIQDVVQSVNALAASAGVTVSPLGADPAAGIPPVDGTQTPLAPGDPNAMNQFNEAVKAYKKWKLEEHGTEEVTETELSKIREEIEKSKPKSKYEQIKERIAARQARLEQLNERAYLDMPMSTTAEMGALPTRRHPSNSSDKTQKTAPAAPSQIEKVPSAQTMANGMSSGAASGETAPAGTWPTKSSKPEKPLQGAGASQTQAKGVKEAGEKSTEKTEEQLTESDQGVRTVTDVYVDRALEAKLDFSKLKEAMGRGLLG